MIEVIKHGQTKFTVICPICGCEFTYTLEDLKDSEKLDLQYKKKSMVECPDCHSEVDHVGPVIINPLYPNVTWEKDKSIPATPLNPYGTNPFTTNWPDCETCPNRPNPDKLIVGDTPCTWCPKMKPYCTCDSTKGK